MAETSLPLVVLGGRDRHGVLLPEAGRGKHPLRGYKAVDLEIGGRPLIAILLERLTASGVFDPIVIAGPARIYAEVCPQVPLIDTDGDFGTNIRAAVVGATARWPSPHIAFTTCDILPEVETLRRLVADFKAHLPCDFWMPQIRVPEDPRRLGASGWKPQYRFAEVTGGSPVATLPGHLVIADPGALRLKLICRLFELAYETRNRSVAYRRTAILRRILGTLLWQDVKLLSSLRAPTATWGVVGNGLALARELRSGTATTEQVAELVRNLFVLHRHRKLHPERRGRFPVVEGLSLAKDVDTEEEAREMSARLEEGREGG